MPKSLKGYNSTPPPSLLERPLRDVFPPELRSTSASGSSSHIRSAFNPKEFLDMLTKHYDHLGHIERQAIVKSAWYGKQTKAAKHEFIVVCVAAPGLENYLVIDRNRGDLSTSSSRGILKLFTSSFGTNALDAFRVSRNGDEGQLLHDCELDSYRRLEQIEFQSGEPLLLHQLATLVCQVSDRSPRYHPVDANCYWFAGLVWEGLRQMRPGAIITELAAKKRGKFGFVRFFTNPLQLKDVVRAVQEEVTKFESRLPASLEDDSSTAGGSPMQKS